MSNEMWFLAGICITLLALIGLILYVRGTLLSISKKLKNMADRFRDSSKPA